MSGFHQISSCTNSIHFEPGPGFYPFRSPGPDLSIFSPCPGPDFIKVVRAASPGPDFIRNNQVLSSTFVSFTVSSHTYFIPDILFRTFE